MFFVFLGALEFGGKGFNKLRGKRCDRFVGNVFIKFVEADLGEGLREVEIVMKGGEELPGSEDGREEGVFENWLH